MRAPTSEAPLPFDSLFSEKKKNKSSKMCLKGTAKIEWVSGRHCQNCQNAEKHRISRQCARGDFSINPPLAIRPSAKPGGEVKWIRNLALIPPPNHKGAGPPAK